MVSVVVASSSDSAVWAHAGDCSTGEHPSFLHTSVVSGRGSRIHRDVHVVPSRTHKDPNILDERYALCVRTFVCGYV